MIRLLSLLAMGLALAASAPASIRPAKPTELERELAGRTAGPPVDCVDNSRIEGPRIIDRRTILYRQSGRRLWLNRLEADCPGLHPDDVLIVHIFGARLCRNDRFESLQHGSTIPGPSCRFGRFVPYDAPARR